MKIKKQLVLFAATIVVATACNQNDAVPQQVSAAKDTVPAKDTTVKSKANIVTTTITNKNGVTLGQAYNNTTNTATLTFNGETIELKGDTMASGTRYSNGHYVLTDWHGEMELLKDGKVVFEHNSSE